MKKAAPLCLLVLFFISCTGPSKIMASWVGRTKAELYQSWGSPSSKTDDGQGGEILIYAATVNLGQTPGQIYNNPDGSVRYITPQNNSYSRTRMFYVNSSGIIYSCR